MGKHIESPFQRTTEGMPLNPIELVHSDICKATSSLVGANYFLILFDDYSRFLWDYTIKSNDKAFGKFREFKLLLRLNANRRLRVSPWMGKASILVMSYDSFSELMPFLGKILFLIVLRKMVWLSLRIGPLASLKGRYITCPSYSLQDSLTRLRHFRVIISMTPPLTR